MFKLERTKLHIIFLLTCVISAVSCLSRVDLTKFQEHITAGNKSYEERNYSQAEGHYRAALKEAEKDGPENTLIARVLPRLSRVNEAQAKYAEAEALYRRAVAISEQVWGSDHPEMLGALNPIADFYLNQGKLAEAETYNNKALSIVEKGVGDDLMLALQAEFTKTTAGAIAEQKRLKEIESWK